MSHHVNSPEVDNMSKVFQMVSTHARGGLTSVGFHAHSKLGGFRTHGAIELSQIFPLADELSNVMAWSWMRS